MEQEGILKSEHTSQQAYVRFLNITSRFVEVIWLNFQGLGITYKILGKRQYCDFDTYVGHRWIFRDSSTRERMVVFHSGSKNPKYVFSPVEYESRNRTTRKWVFIALPIFSLKEICFQNLKNLLPNHNKIFDLQIPNTLKEDFISYSEYRKYLN